MRFDGSRRTGGVGQQLISLMAAAIVALPSPAAAQSAARPKLATREEIRACLDEEDSLKPQRAALDRQLKEHDAELKQHQDEMNALVAQQPEVDTRDRAAVDAFNARMDAMNARVQGINERGEEFNRDQARFNARVAAMNKRCAALVYSLRDRDAVLKERAAKNGAGQ